MPDPESHRLAKQVYGVLGALVLLDVVLSLWVFISPELWFTAFHGVPYEDPQGLLPRMGANWSAFALFQILALLRWHKDRWWLAVVAGIRLSDIFTDWTYLACCGDITWFGQISLAVTSPMNLLVGLWLLKVFRGRS